MKKTLSAVVSLILIFAFSVQIFAMSESEWNTYWSSEEKEASVYVSPGHTESERYFTWYAKENGKGNVTLKTKSGEKTFSAKAQNTPQGDYIYKAFATGLESGEYTYVCKGGGFESEERTLTVSNSSDFSALYVTDVHMTASDGEEKLRSHALSFNNTIEKVSENYGASLILSAGDQATMGLRKEYTAFVSSPVLKTMTTALSVGLQNLCNASV